MDVLVVGMGFSGSIASLLASEYGYDVTAADPNDVIPHCTGIISYRLARLLGIEDLILAKPQRLLLKYGKFQTLIDAPDKAVVIDREELDKRLREAAIAAGANFIKRAVRRIDPRGVAVIQDEKEYRRIISAEGASRSLTYHYFGHLGKLPGIQFDVRQEWPEDLVLIDLNVPDLFGRVVPLGEGLVRIGLASRNLRRRLAYMKRTYIKGPIKSRRAGSVVISGPKGGLYYGRIVLVGDAAGVPKPLTGGGLAFGLLNVIYAIRNLEDPKKYEEEFMSLMGKEYKRQKFLRALKEAARILPRLFMPAFNIAKMLASHLDMDFRSGIRTYPLSDISRIRSYLQGT